MSLFSERHELTRAALIVDDAPRWFRSVFYEQALSPYMSIGRGDIRQASFERPINPVLCMERLSQHCRREIGNHYLNPALAASELRTFVMSCEWFYFFDAIEIAASMVLISDRIHSWEPQKIFPQFQVGCNLVFQTSGVGWKLQTNGKLERTATEEVALAEKQLATIQLHSPAKVHIAKARLMLQQRPCDAANAIKESVSAIESAGRQAYPKTSTLGDVLKEMKKDSKSPPMFLAALEKLYAFASAEPGVRHGSSGDERVSRAEAEFIFTTALSTITYLEALGLLQ